MEIHKFNDLKKYNINGLVKIAVYNQVYNNEYYISKKELKIALYNCLLVHSLKIPDNMKDTDFMQHWKVLNQP
jgi:hypothetical protein